MSLLTITTHFAYLDGGTGSLVIQALLAGLLTSGYVIKTRWAQLKQAIARRQNSTTTSK